MIPAENKRQGYRGADYSLLQEFYDKTSGSEQPLDLTTYDEIIWRGQDLRRNEVWVKKLSDGDITISGDNNEIISSTLDKELTKQMGHDYYVYDIYFKKGEKDLYYEKGRLYMGDVYSDNMNINTSSKVTIDQQTEQVTLSDSAVYATFALDAKEQTDQLKSEVEQLKTDVENIQTDVTNKQQDVTDKAQQVSDDKDTVSQLKSDTQTLRDESKTQADRSEQEADRSEQAANVNARDRQDLMPFIGRIGYQLPGGNFYQMDGYRLAELIQKMDSTNFNPMAISWDQGAGATSVSVQQATIFKNIEATWNQDTEAPELTTTTINY